MVLWFSMWPADVGKLLFLTGLLHQARSEPQSICLRLVPDHMPMARRYLYHVTPTRNVTSILKTGLEPRAGTWRGLEWPARVWLATGKDAAYMTADIFLFEWRYDCGFRTPIQSRPADYWWTIEGKAGGYWWIHYGFKDWWIPTDNKGRWRLVRGGTLSIVVIDRTKIPGAIHPNDQRDFHQMGTARKRQLATVWTADPIPPGAIIRVAEVDQSYLISPAFRRYAGVDIRGVRSR